MARRHVLFLIVLGLNFLALTWPGLALLPPLEPYILGLPAPLAWILAWLVILFLALLTLFLAEGGEGEEGG